MKRVLKWTLIVLLLGVPILFFVGCVAFFAPESWHTYHSPDDCGSFVGVPSSLVGRIFPDRSLMTEENCTFYRAYVTDGSNYPEFLTMAFCRFSADEYDGELARLAELANAYSDTAFEKPAYILMFERRFVREYALVEEETHSIHYISYYCPWFLKQTLYRIPAEDRIRPEAADLEVPYNSEQSKEYEKGLLSPSA